MKIYMLADMEGISGICRSAQVRAGGQDCAQDFSGTRMTDRQTGSKYFIQK